VRGALRESGSKLALRRMEAAGARLTSWAQVRFELQRDWARRQTYAGSYIVKSFAGGYGMGMANAKDMVSSGLAYDSGFLERQIRSRRRGSHQGETVFE
jgi:hypothetical protein